VRREVRNARWFWRILVPAAIVWAAFALGLWLGALP
jgi:hypothetical protein